MYLKGRFVKYLIIIIIIIYSIYIALFQSSKTLNNRARDGVRQTSDKRHRQAHTLVHKHRPKGGGGGLGEGGGEEMGFEAGLK